MVLTKLVRFVTRVFIAVSHGSGAVADPNVTVLAFGLVGSQSVFESEARGSAAILAQRLGAGNVVAQANTKTRGDVTIESIKAAVQSSRVCIPSILLGEAPAAGTLDPAAEAVSLVAGERADLCRIELITLVREVLSFKPSTFQRFGFLGCRTAGF
jgi:hypothetical protein